MAETSTQFRENMKCPYCLTVMRYVCEHKRNVQVLIIQDFPSDYYRSSPWIREEFYKCPNCGYIHNTTSELG